MADLAGQAPAAQILAPWRGVAQFHELEIRSRCVACGVIVNLGNHQAGPPRGDAERFVVPLTPGRIDDLQHGRRGGRSLGVGHRDRVVPAIADGGCSQLEDGAGHIGQGSAVFCPRVGQGAARCRDLERHAVSRPHGPRCQASDDRRWRRDCRRCCQEKVVELRLTGALTDQSRAPRGERAVVEGAGVDARAGDCVGHGDGEESGGSRAVDSKLIPAVPREPRRGIVHEDEICFHACGAAFHPQV